MTISIAALIAPVTKSWNYRGTAPSREVASRDSASFSQHLPHLNRRRANARWPTPVCETRASTEDNFEVFRFTLGVDFLDDEDIPRVAGLFCAAFLFVNHFASGNAPVAQARTEITSTLLACACITTPLIGRRLLEASPGKIGEETGIVGGEEFFTFSSDVSDETRAEIASEYKITPKTLRCWVKKAQLNLPSGYLTPRYQKLIYDTFGYPFERAGTA